MKLDKAPTESYADIGGLEQQIQEIKVRPTAPYRPSQALTSAISTRTYRNLSNYH